MMSLTCLLIVPFLNPNMCIHHSISMQSVFCSLDGGLSFAYLFLFVQLERVSGDWEKCKLCTHLFVNGKRFHNLYRKRS